MKKLQQLESKILDIRGRISSLGRLRSGELSDRGHGHKMLRYSVSGGRGVLNEPIHPGIVPDIELELANYVELKWLLSEWLELEVELSQLKIRKHNKGLVRG